MVERSHRPCRLSLFLMLFASVLIVQQQMGGTPSLPGPFGEGVRSNALLEKELSTHLGVPVVVYDTAWFHIIASVEFEDEVKNALVPGITEAVVEFRNIFHFGKDKNPPWNEGEKGRLVLLKERETYLKFVELLEKAARPKRNAPDLADQAAHAQSFFLIDPRPCAACCGEETEWREMVQHLFHLLGHVLLTSYDFNHKYAPPWLHEGFGAYMAIRYGGGNILYCTEGLNHNVFGTGVFKDLSAWARSENWPEFLCGKTHDDPSLSLGQLDGLSMTDFAHQHVALSWSVVAFLIEEHPDKLRSYVKALKAQPASLAPDSDWPPEAFSRKVFSKAFGKSIEKIETEWKAWARKEPDHAARAPVKTGNRDAKDCVSFDPAYHLEEFTRFEGEETKGPLAPFLERAEEWMNPETLEKIRDDWSKVRLELLSKLEGQKARSLPGMEPFLADLASDPSAQYLDEEALIALVQAGGSEDILRAVFRYFVEGSGCQGAISRLKNLPASVREQLKDGKKVEDLELLQQAARFEERLFKELTRIKASTRVDCWPARVNITAVEDSELILTGKKAKGAHLSDPGACEGIQVAEHGKGIEIRYPRARFDTGTLVALGKSALKWKSSEDRLGYALLYLFRGDVASIRSEMRFLKDREEDKVRLSNLAAEYERSGSAVMLLRFLSHEIAGNPKDHIQELSALMVALKGSNLLEGLKPRLEPVLRRWLCENYIIGNRLLQTYKGFRGINNETGEACFLYEFDDPEEIKDFDSGESRLGQALKARYKVDSSIETEPFQVQKGNLACYGLDFISLKPVFTGDTELAVHLKVAKKDKKSPESMFQCMFGYGLSRTGAYVASACLTHLEIQSSAQGKYKLLEAGVADRSIGPDRPSTIFLKGTFDRILYRFGDAENVIFQEKGQRTGKIFLWVHGPRQFEIDRLDVKAAIDPGWLIQVVERAVNEDLGSIL